MMTRFLLFHQTQDTTFRARPCNTHWRRADPWLCGPDCVHHSRVARNSRGSHSRAPLRVRRRLTLVASAVRRTLNQTSCGTRPPRRTCRPSAECADLDIPEGYGELLVLKTDVPFRKSCIVSIERRLAIQDDHDVVPIRSYLIVIPLIRL